MNMDLFGSKEVKKEEYKFIPNTDDRMFKTLFVGNREICEGFLKAVLGREVKIVKFGDREVTSVTRDGKDSRLDLVVDLGSGEMVNVEIQRKPESWFSKRTLFYWSALYSRQEFKDYSDLRPVIVINILDHYLMANKGNKNPHSVFRLKNEMGNILSDVLVIHFLELKKVKFMEEESTLNLWLNFLNAKSEGEIDMLKNKDEVLDKAIEARSLAFDKLMERWKADVPWLNAIEEASAASATKEATTGRAILKMHMAGVPVSTIAEFQSVSEDYVKKVLEEGPQDWWDTY